MSLGTWLQPMVRLHILADLGVSVARVLADHNMVPDYEVKLLMIPTAVLGTDNKLKPTVLSTFAMPTSVTKMNVQFLDTSIKEIYNVGWSPRIRKMEGENGFELTYKKRYGVTGGNIDGILIIANTEGFDSGDTGRKKSASGSGYSGMDLPGQSKSREFLIDETPDKFDDWLGNGWGTSALASARIFGPILAKRSIGTWNSTELYIEVWPIKDAVGTGTAYIVEASFKTMSRTAASEKHDDLITFLQGKGWFLAQDSLKTQLIMDRY